MSWRELLHLLEPLIPDLGIAAILTALAVVAFAVTGSMAAVEITRYYRRKNRTFEEAERRESLSVSERELRNTLQGAVVEAVAPLRSDLVEVKAELGRGKQAQVPEVV
ncbi:MAG TPA: hypothetical protein VFG50_01810 [Rhodothermales bacterium]|nr:hypothetical protein [Rhodothermales bacterium]